MITSRCRSTMADKPCDLGLWSFQLRINACRGPAVHYTVLTAQAVFLSEYGQTDAHTHRQ